MFGLLSRASRTRKPGVSRFVNLSLERLEDRLSPADISPPPPLLPPPSSPPPPPLLPPPAVESITLNVSYLPNREATFSGQLTNQSGPMANQTVNLTGVVNGTATTNAQGNYSITLAVPQLGTESAASADGQSNTAECMLAVGAPMISNFTAMSLGDGLWEFSGTVSGAPTQGEVVNFGGITALKGQSDTVNSDGTFDFYAIVNSGQGGWASAQAVDWWGDTSAYASEFVNC